MMNNNKILTVSYGTFSCTLEGFDDSFGTMKAIAEYFRDLAADDRYFGAEPPQPDAEMLTRIAQKEISRRVQAREHDGKIVLSALEDSSTPLSDAAASPTAGLATLANVVAKAPESEAGLEAATAQTVEEAPQTESPAPEIAAEEAAPVDLSLPEAHEEATPAEEIDDAGAAVRADDLTPSEVLEEAPEASVAEQGEDEVASDAAEITAETIEDERDIVPGQSDAAVEAFFADMAAASAPSAFEEDAAVAEDVPEATQEPQPEAPAPDSIAAKLQRIRAVVAQHDDSADDDDYDEDEYAELNAADAGAITADIENAAAADTFDTIAQARSDIEDALDADAATDQADLSETDENEDFNAILSRLETLDIQSETEIETADFEEEDSAEDEDALANLFGEEDEDESIIGQADVADDDAAELEDAAEALPAPRARVIKVKRADLEAAIQRGVLEEYDDEYEDFDLSDQDAPASRALDDMAPSKSATTSLSAEEEQELARELAELEKDIESGADDDDFEMDADDQHDHDDRIAAGRSVLPEIEDETTGDMTRLMAEADHQMDEPESTTRRNAFAHLRAAVAAKKADAAIGIHEDEDKTDNAYRSDLAEVVRPRRPISGSARTPRPEEVRPAPLKLVAEQRIDVAAPRPAGPVRPRRVAATVTESEAPKAEGESFAEFAEEMGATSLPELLEAAAAYMAFVEGFEQFSRPQLMTKVRQVGIDQDFSREDGLRSFGQLLRAGKIEKIKGGRFTVSEDIGYRPDQRAAG